MYIMFNLGVTTVKQVTITYNLGNLADWVSAIATLSAVIVSLYLSNKHDRPRIVLSFMDNEQDTCRITNKSSQPVELRLSLSNGNKNMKFAIPPIQEQITSIKNDQPFNKDYMIFMFNSKSNKMVTAKGVDLVSNAKYHFLFFKKNGDWQIKEYRFIHLGKLTI